METKQLELVFAHPTKQFYSMLCKNLPKQAIPAKNLLETDQTGYFIKRHHEKEDTVEEIFRHYNNMYLYECRRWLGRQYHPSQVVNLLTFSKCFNLNFHQNIYLFEQNQMSDRHRLIALQIKPTELLVSWFQVNTMLQPGLATQVNRNIMVENTSIILHKVHDFDELSEFVLSQYQVFAGLEQSRLALPVFPKIESFADFKRFFCISIHQHIKFLVPMEEEI